MYPSREAITRDVKREVMAELQQGHRAGISPSGSGFAAEQTYQAVKDSVKNEVLAEIQMQQLDRMGLGRTLSDQNIQQMINARYRAVDDMRADIKKELLALQEMEAQRSKDPQVRQIADVLLEEARRQGIPREQLARTLDRRNGTGSGAMARLSDMLNKGQRKGFLGGMGLMLLCHLLMPSARGKVHSVAVRSMEEGMAMMDRARTFVSSRYRQPPSPDAAGDQPPPADMGPPPGDNVQ